MAKLNFRGKVYGIGDPATTNDLGVVKPDGQTILVAEDPVTHESTGEFYINPEVIPQTLTCYAFEAEGGVAYDPNASSGEDGYFDYSVIPDKEYAVDLVTEYVYYHQPEEDVDNDGVISTIVESFDRVTTPTLITDIMISEELYETSFDLKNSKTIRFWVD
jgi:hypothetical protein